MKGDESSVNGPSVVPLRTILQNFLNLVENYEARRNGGLDSYDSEFQELKQFSESLKSDPDYICKEGERGVNRKKNRYKDILPFDYTRVSLSDCGDDPGSDYINANFIKGASGSSAYIACQGPLPHTVNAFWRMLVECEVQVVVMACNEQESGKHKCENYWVEEDGVEREFGEVTVWLKKTRQVCPDFLVRTMRIRFTNGRGEKEERNVCQFHYSAWPDHGVPTKVRPLLDMVRLIRDCQTSETLPVLVHCSAGCGRTGTICAIDYVWGLLRLGKLSPDFSLFKLVREMRRQRIAMVQTKDQYILVHRAVKELFQEQLKLIDSHPYANVPFTTTVDENGLPLEIKKDLEEPTYETLHFTPSSSSAKLSHLTPLLPPPPLKNDIVKADNIVVSVSNIHSNSNSSKPGLTPSSTNHVIPLPSRMNKSNSSKFEKNFVESNLKHSDNTTNSANSSSKGGDSLHTTTTNHKIMEQPRQGSSSFSDDDKHDKRKKEKKMSSSSDDTDTCDRESINKQQQQQQQQQKSSNPIRSALLRKPSIVKLKSFFEKNSNKEEKGDKPTPQKLSRAKSDVSTRFYSFISSRSSPAKTVVTPSSSSSSVTPSSSNDPSGNSTSPPPSNLISLNEDSKSKKPTIMTKPIINIKRSKSLKVPIQPDSVKLTPVVKNSNSKSSQQRLDKHHHQQQQISRGGGSLTSSNPSTSSSSGFSNILTDNNPIKVCVKQVEIPKLQAIVSKSVKAEVQKATTTTATSNSSASHEYDYDISDGSHLRQKPITTSSMLQLEQSKSAKASGENNNKKKKIDLGLPPILQPITSYSLLHRKEEEERESRKPTPPSRIHIQKDNHNNYVNVSYGANRSRTGMAKEMEDLNVVQDNYASSSNYGGKYGKLKKCDTVNPRILASSFGFPPPNYERTSLTRSQSHVWQSEDDKQQQRSNIFSRIFSDENLHHQSVTTKATSAGVGGKSNGDFTIPLSQRDSSSPTKTTLATLNNSSSTTNGDNYLLSNHRKSLASDDVGGDFLIQAISADVSVQRYDSTSDIFDNNVHSKSEKGGGDSSSLTTNVNPSTYHSNSNSPLCDKPLVRRRVPKTNPYANYPACVTGSSKFPYHKLQGQPPNGNSTSMMDDSFHMSDGNLTKDSGSIPLLKPSYGGSVGNSSSGSSSNTGTPNSQNSLPSTPTQSVSVDVLYPQLHRLCANTNSNNGGRNPSVMTTPNNNGRVNGYQGTNKASSSESEDKVDSASFPSRIYSSSNTMSIPSNNNNNSSTSNIPKIRLPVGVRERRNSFRQAVWKEAAANSSNSNSNSILNSHYGSIDNQVSSGTVSSPISNHPPYSITPYHHVGSSITTTTTQSSNDAPPPPRIPKNYEPIWPNDNSTTNFRQPSPYSSTTTPTPTTNTTSLENSRRPFIMSTQQSKLGNSYGFPQNKADSTSSGGNSAWSQSRQNPIGGNANNSNNASDPTFQSKVDEIKIMLAELNAPVGSGKPSSSMSGKTEMSSSSKGHGNINNSNSGNSKGVSSIKQQRSLRAPSRSQYQGQSLSCFTFKKPSSFESIHQLQNDDDEYEPLVSPGSVYGKLDDSTTSTRSLSRPFHERDRVTNDYVTLQQCRSSSENPYGQSSSSRQSSSSPDFPKKSFHPNENCGVGGVPIPPPRTKRNHHLLNSAGGRLDFSGSSGGDKHVVVDSTSRIGGLRSSSTPNNNDTSDPSSTYLQPKTTENCGMNTTNHHVGGGKSNYSHLDQINDNVTMGQEDFSQRHGGEGEEHRTNPNINSTSPKAIIRALGLFQAKAANVRSRFANWSEAKERSNASKRNYENGFSNNSSDREGSEEPGHSSNGFRTSPSPGTFTGANGPLPRSKHQYL